MDAEQLKLQFYSSQHPESWFASGEYVEQLRVYFPGDVSSQVIWGELWQFREKWVGNDHNRGRPPSGVEYQLCLFGDLGWIKLNKVSQF